MYFRIPARWSMVVPACLSLFIGCDSQLGRVSGTVTFSGQPLKQGRIVFESAGARPATGEIRDGRIVEVTTNDLNDGAAIGSHQVAVFSVKVSNESAVSKHPGDNTPSTMTSHSLIPDRYGDPAKSGLTAEIKAGANELRFDLVP